MDLNRRFSFFKFKFLQETYKNPFHEKKSLKKKDFILLNDSTLLYVK